MSGAMSIFFFSVASVTGLALPSDQRTQTVGLQRQHCRQYRALVEDWQIGLARFFPIAAPTNGLLRS